jgi:methenyltetrahydromethanopterin cyclohydrolase
MLIELTGISSGGKRMHEVLSVNELSWKIAEKLLNKQAFYGVHASKSTSGATIIDAGVNTPGGFQAGKILTELCMGGAGKAQLGFKPYGEITFPSITISTDHPAIAALGSQFAGWRIKEPDGSIAIGSGPARALALKPKDVFEEIGYKDASDKAVITLESNVFPSNTLIEKVSGACSVKPENLIAVVAPTASVAGLTQVTGRIVEVGIHKLRTLGLNPKTIKYACGFAPIPPLGKDFEVAMARTNDAILYGGTVYLTVESQDEAALQTIVERAPSKTSKDYGKPFLQIFREADRDFYKIDHSLFAPAALIVNNSETGNVFRAGEINPKILEESLGL